MGVPLNLTDIQSGFLSASAFNQNNTLTEAALAKALDRTGASDNAMEADLDMGLNWINNVRDANLNHQATPFGQVQRLVTASGDQVTSTAEKDTFIASAGQTVFNLSNIEYIQGVNALLVFVNGVYQRSGTDYLESLTTQIEFTSGLEEGDVVVVIGARFNAEVFVTEAQGFAGAANTSANLAELAEINASASSDEAENWANYPEDSLVPEGDLVDDYSALHWAEKSKDAAGYKLGINTQSGTSYTLVASDEGDLVRMTNANANTVTVPDNATVAFEVGTVVNIRQSGTGTTTVSPDTGVTINAPLDEFTTDGEEFGVALVKVGTDEWDLVKSYAGVRNDQFESDISADTSTSGYQKLPSGLILQWGVNSSSGSPVTYSFPIPFPNAAIGIYASAETQQGTWGSASIIDNTSFQVNRVNANQSGGVPWLALGV